MKPLRKPTEISLGFLLNFNGFLNCKNIFYSLWRNDHQQVFKGKFSTGATPKISKDFKATQSPNSGKKANKKIKKSLFCDGPDCQNHKTYDFPKENLGDSFNMTLEPNSYKERTPSPKKKSTKDHFNTMSIKKERKIFNKREDLDPMNGECYEQNVRYMTTTKPKMNDANESNTNSRFVNDYDILEVYFILI